MKIKYIFGGSILAGIFVVLTMYSICGGSGLCSSIGLLSAGKDFLIPILQEAFPILAQMGLAASLMQMAAIAQEFAQEKMLNRESKQKGANKNQQKDIRNSKKGNKKNPNKKKNNLKKRRTNRQRQKNSRISNQRKLRRTNLARSNALRSAQSLRAKSFTFRTIVTRIFFKG